MSDAEKYGIPALAIGAGVVFMYSGIKGYSVLGAIQNLIAGKPVSQGLSETTQLTNQASATGNTPAGQAPGDWKSNEQMGQALAASVGWTMEEWTALDALWNRESGWNNRAQNPSSGAYGIPQALPYSKMPNKAWPESAGGQSDPQTQIQWGIEYIQGRYGSPSHAWAHEQQNGWY